ncbi:MAG: tetratricopeptide repeat protein [Cyanobacterium sp. T60_A2020_053]|nr:tetratricopeptide repeat protein [Cyanobacterium sp. T60_A2020_053]
MNSFIEEEFKKQYQQGKLAFERGQYRLSVECLESACKLIPQRTPQGGEVQLWLVNAYQAKGDTGRALELCQYLCSHPHGETKSQAVRLLYILQAPELQRPSSWMTPIPDLTDSSNKYIVNQSVSSPRKIKPKPQIELVDLSQVNTKDNSFLWLGLLVSLGAIFFFIP